MAHIRCIYGREPRSFELWDFNQDGIRKVHPFSRFQINDDFIKDTFYSHFSMHDKSKFVSWVAEPWTEVSDGSMFPIPLAELEVVLGLGLRTPSFIPGVPILIWFRIVLSGDVQLIMFLLTPTLLHAELITNAFAVFVLSRYKLLR